MIYYPSSRATALALGGEHRVVTDHGEGRRWRWPTLAAALESTGLRGGADDDELPRIAGAEQDGRQPAVLARGQLRRYEVQPRYRASNGLRWVRPAT